MFDRIELGFYLNGLYCTSQQSGAFGRSAMGKCFREGATLARHVKDVVLVWGIEVVYDRDIGYQKKYTCSGRYTRDGKWVKDRNH